MELNDTQIKEYKGKLLEVFKTAIEFFEKNHLTWWAYAGTAIGAVRHHGLIPWDDDIDIFMPYDDYCRLQNMNHEFENTTLEIYRPFEGDYYLPYMKIADRNSTVSELESFKFVGGIGIDIFPLYKTNATEEAYWSHVKKYGKFYERYMGAKRRFLWSDLLFYVKGFHLRTFNIWIKSMTLYKWISKKNETEFKDYLDTIHNPQSRNYMFPFTYMHSLNLFPIEWFSSTIEMDFEDFKVKMPVGYDDILKRLYGDYMTPPPPEKRNSTHSFYFVDFHRRYSYDEIRKLKH